MKASFRNRHTVIAALVFATTSLALLPVAANGEVVGAGPAADATAVGDHSTAVQPPTRQDNPTPQPAPPSAHPWRFAADPEAYSIVGAGSGFSFHKPMYFEPYTYSPDYNGKHSELVFQISLKLRLFRFPHDGALYGAYTQKSFWDAYDGGDSRPFRETDYNPELFYRYIPHNVEKWHHLGLDIGAEHISNGRSLPNSRSWNRIYIAPFQAEGNHLVYLKLWWRIPEDESKSRTNPNRDDNPDIQDYYGYGQIDYEQQLFGDQLAHLMVRYNVASGRGAVSFNYSIPGPGNRFFWGLFLFHGYGDSLIDYDRVITRVGLGIMLSR